MVNLQSSQKSVSLQRVFIVLDLNNKVGARRCSFLCLYAWFPKKNGIFVNHNTLKNCHEKARTSFSLAYQPSGLLFPHKEILKIGFIRAIKEYVTNHNTEFQKLMQRFERKWYFTTRQDHAMLYYGIHSPAIKGKYGWFSGFRKLIKEESMKMLIISAKELLKESGISNYYIICTE